MLLRPGRIRELAACVQSCFQARRSLFGSRMFSSKPQNRVRLGCRYQPRECVAATFIPG